MPYDKTNKKLYVDTANNQGLTPWEVAQCIGDYRTNKIGQRDIGMLCTSDNVNIAAKFKPIAVDVSLYNPYKVLTEEDFRRNGWGLLFEGSPYEHDDRLIMHTYSWKKPDGNNVKRLRDFDGYIHNAKLGISFDKTSISYNPETVTTYNYGKQATVPEGSITLEDLLETLIPDYASYGFEIRCNSGCIVYTQAYSTWEAMLTQFQSQGFILNTPALASHPNRLGAVAYLYGVDSEHNYKHVITPLVTINDYRANNRSGIANFFTPKMKVGTYRSGFTTQYLSETEIVLEIGSTATNGNGDRLMFAFQLKPNSGEGYSPKSVAMKVKGLGGQSITIPIGYNQSKPNEWSAGSASGLGYADYNIPSQTASNLGEGYFFVRGTDIRDFIGNNITESLTFQVYEATWTDKGDVSDGNVTLGAALSSPVTLTVRCTESSVDSTIPFRNLDPLFIPA